MGPYFWKEFDTALNINAYERLQELELMCEGPGRRHAQKPWDRPQQLDSRGDQADAL